MHPEKAEPATSNGKSESHTEVVATRKVSGGFAGMNNTLTVHADGTLRFSDLRLNRSETRKVPRAQIRPLRNVFDRPEWQEVEPFYGQPVPDGFEIVVEGGGRRSGLASPSAEPVTIPPVLEKVLGHLRDLWPADGAVTDPPGFPEPNLFQLEGKGVEITYGVLRARREFLDYRDGQRELSFSGEAGEIDSFEGRIGKLLTVELNHDEFIADANLITLTLLLPRINPEGQESSFETIAIRTTHLTGFRPGPAEGAQQLYEVLPLRGTAGQAD
jgi:hypothetical protein